jgi:ComF family protein
MVVNKNNKGKVNRAPEPGDHVLPVPGICYLCSGALNREELFICAACNDDLPMNIPACPHCALPVTVAGVTCGNCLATTGRVPGDFYALFPYTFPISRLIHDLKFHARIEIAWFLGFWMAKIAIESGLSIPQCLVPVPLHKFRVAERGYNQSLEIARAAGSMLNIPVCHDFCCRTINTPPQSSVNAETRAKNLRGAFAIVERCSSLPEHIALVDDVITTGATVNELARVFCNNGVPRVDVWAAARTSFTGHI